MSLLSNFVGKIPGIGPAINSVAHNVLDPLARGAISKIPGGSIALTAGDMLGKIPGLQSVGGFLGGNGGKNALGVAEGVNAAMLTKKQNELASNALGSVQSDYDSRAPLRTAGMAGMLHPEAGISAKIQGLSQGFNPYQRPAIAPVGQAPAPAPQGAAPSVGPAADPAPSVQSVMQRVGQATGIGR